MTAEAGGALPSERPRAAVDVQCSIRTPRPGSVGGLTLHVLTPQPAKEALGGGP